MNDENISLCCTSNNIVYNKHSLKQKKNEVSNKAKRENTIYGNGENALQVGGGMVHKVRVWRHEML